MATAEIIAIGTELLLGETVDTNTPFLLKELNELGIDVFRTVIVGDNPRRISEQIIQSLDNADLVITTGGLGPTIDDPTRQAVADAFESKLLFSDALWTQIEDRFKRFNHHPTENNRKQAFIPEVATAIENTVGTAPSFYVEKNGKVVISLPGVPAEVIHIFKTKCIPIIRQSFDINFTTFSRIIRTAGLGESSLDDLIGKFEELSNPTVGLTAKPGQVNIRITAKAPDTQSAQEMIKPIEDEIIEILDDYVYGYDDDTLAEVVRNLISVAGVKVHLLYDSLPQSLADQLENLHIFRSIKNVGQQDTPSQKNISSLYNNSTENEYIVLLKIDRSGRQAFNITIKNADLSSSKEFHFGGHADLFNSWVENHLLNTLRKELI